MGGGNGVRPRGRPPVKVKSSLSPFPLSTVLNSERAIQVNIEIMRAFVRLREILSTHKDLATKLKMLERKYDAQFKVVFDAIRQLMTPPEPNKRKIGCLVKERPARYGKR